jgi:uncharacterized membrane protein
MSQLEYAIGRGPRSERNYAITSYLRRPTFDQRRRRFRKPRSNVGNLERMASIAAGAALAALGVSRKSLSGLLLAGLGGGFVVRGVTGHCGVYDKLDIDTRQRPVGQHLRGPHPARHGVHVVESVLINKPASDLYDLWRNLENLPRIMSHLESVRVLDEQRSHWVADAPRLVGGRVEWDAEIIRDEPNTRIAWRSLPGSQIDQRGMVSFLPAPGERGVIVRVDVEYRPPAGQVGHWVATLLGEDPARQIHDDLRKLKQTLEIGEVVTVEGQSRGSCLDRGNARG